VGINLRNKIVISKLVEHVYLQYIDKDCITIVIHQAILLKFCKAVAVPKHIPKYSVKFRLWGGPGAYIFKGPLLSVAICTALWDI